jgi:hypothetical protein
MGVGLALVICKVHLDLAARSMVHFNHLLMPSSVVIGSQTTFLTMKKNGNPKSQESKCLWRIEVLHDVNVFWVSVVSTRGRRSITSGGEDRTLALIESASKHTGALSMQLGIALQT